MNQAGKSTRKMAQNRRRTTNLILVGILIVTIILAIVIQNWQALGFGGGTVLLLLVVLKVLPDLIDRPIKRRAKAERRAGRGAAAEEELGNMLAGLGGDYFVLHDVTSAYGNIDHIVIGKHSGVFLIETKAHGGHVEVMDDKILVNGNETEKNFISQVLRNTYWLRDEIEKVTGSKIWITPLIVFTNAFVQPGKPIKGVVVINKKFLPRLLNSQNRSVIHLMNIWNARDELASRLGA